MLTRQQILDLIAEEKSKYSTYMQSCAYYKIDPDPIATTKCQSKIDLLENLLKS